MNYQGRIRALQQHMVETGVDLIYLTRGANLFYLTGIRRQLDHQTDHNAYGDWASGGFLGQQGNVVVLAPRMGGHFFEVEAEGKPWVGEVRLVDESESPLEVLRQELGRFGHHLGSIAIDDRAWTQTSLALQELLPEARISMASSLIMPLRMIKDVEEVAAMTAASAVADETWQRIIPFLKLGVSEQEIAREIDHQFDLLGAEYPSFVTGISFYGPSDQERGNLTRATNQRRLTLGDSITFDFGCVLDGYCSDFGRSAFAGVPPGEYRQVHELVLASQRAGMEAMRAGQITGAEVNAIARRVIANAGYDAAFTHRLGHAIGITVHEQPTLDVVDQTVLQENMMFTVEPSVFIRGRLGNRVEDVVQVTPSGGVSLNQASHELVIVTS